MDLAIIDKDTRLFVTLIKTYTYVQYTHEYSGVGEFEIKIPTIEESREYLVFGNYIYFEEGIVGIIKGVKDSEDSDIEVTVYGYLVNHILQYRSFLLTTTYYSTVSNAVRQMVTDLFISPEDSRRTIDFITLSSNPDYIPSISGNETFQNTGNTLFDYLHEALVQYDLGFELYPVVQSSGSGENLQALEFRIITPADRSIGNLQGNTPVVFSFDLNNLSKLEYEEDGRVYATTALVASEGEGQDRKTKEVGDLVSSGIDRIELYVDARDLQESEEVTEAQLYSLMEQRGLEKLEEHLIFASADGTIITGSMQYTYGVDFKLGDYVSVFSKRLNRVFTFQVTAVKKSLSSGKEMFDITFGKDRLDVRRMRG